MGKGNVKWVNVLGRRVLIRLSSGDEEIVVERRVTEISPSGNYLLLAPAGWTHISKINLVEVLDLSEAELAGIDAKKS